MTPLRIARVEGFAFRQPLTDPVATSFGIMRDRPAVFVRIEDAEGGFGWGEVFANWPAAGAEHRVRLLVQDVAPLLIRQAFDDPPALFRHLDAATRIRALQCGEPGPFAQVVAGLDIAAWDLAARRRGLPLARMLGATRDAIPCYASGIPIARAGAMVAAARAAGFPAAKVKVGFGPGEAAQVNRLLAEARIAIMADANQAWEADAAADFLDAVDGLAWLEEPVIATAPDAVWARLARRGTPLAGGENLAGAQFDAAIAAGHLSVIQPDVAKWGGITGCRAVGRAAVAAGRRYCPHFLGGGIGLAASAHLLAAVGGDGLLEVDVNPNALRDAFGGDYAGRWTVPDTPGLGIATLPEALAPFLTLHESA
ncbi:mandelate racemase/muconate lactonizing enzyme family protein [Jannaschia ovalis]|uniref:Enolase C-terminal domain-like protein n=1 Tax=Jannaschia ovalis TaxID=3038773 RepID=A0ABY8L7D8_9RHOB|nr:enolase C-terminal domain-like protein [Jannaschia sp. GRR-S6-38]WGH77291.1 enolase C-terminal domain-like protein [Jannaschia sp. GRR-S6-38]